MCYLRAEREKASSEQARVHRRVNLIVICVCSCQHGMCRDCSSQRAERAASHARAWTLEMHLGWERGETGVCRAPGGGAAQRGGHLRHTERDHPWAHITNFGVV